MVNNMQTAPKSNRLHIGIFGKTNSGKSALLNAITGQEVSLVAPEKGTTTDAVFKPMEIAGLGPVVFVDTAGLSDDSALGEKRLALTKRITEKIDAAILLLDEGGFEPEETWLRILHEKKVTVILAISKCELPGRQALAEHAEKVFDEKPLLISAQTKAGIPDLIARLKTLNAGEEPSLIEGLVTKKDLVLLVMPQDKGAPKGRLILPQVQTIRSLLDGHCITICVTDDEAEEALASLKEPPSLIIVDSSVFKKIAALKPAASRLTSFSILFSAQKGDIKTFLDGAKKIRTLSKTARVLIQESCTHAPQTEDIGRVKIPALLRKKISPDLHIDVRSGFDFPENVNTYDLIIQCGSCMLTRKQVLNRLDTVKAKNIPITNYGIAIAELQGILDMVDIGN